MNKASEIIGFTEGGNSTQEQKEVKLVDVAVSDENVALNLMVSFLSLAQRRGCFSFDESAKIWECVKKFQKTM
jgi:predicted transcriptional regulator